MGDTTVPGLEALETAYETTRRVTLETPLLESEGLARRSGAARVFVKPESLQRTGSFKFRGAYWRVQRLSPEEKARGVVAYSSGNFAQGLAAAAAMSEVPATIVMPVDAPPAKRRGAEAFGARIVESDTARGRARRWRAPWPGSCRGTKASPCSTPSTTR